MRRRGTNEIDLFHIELLFAQRKRKFHELFDKFITGEKNKEITNICLIIVQFLQRNFVACTWTGDPEGSPCISVAPIKVCFDQGHQVLEIARLYPRRSWLR